MSTAMAQSNGPRKLRCDCALTFDNGRLLGNHIKQTGHMKDRWCTLCCQLFSKKDSLDQHKKMAAKHKGNPNLFPKTVPSKAAAPRASVSKNKPQVEKPNSTSNIPVAGSKAPKAPTGVKGKKKSLKGPAKVVISNTTQTMQSSPSTASAPNMPVPAAFSDPVATKYPWASNQASRDLLKALTARCHDENCLVSQGYYVSDWACRKHQLLPTPARVNGVIKRRAMAIDCEMVGVANGRDELARLCAVDIISGEVLIDTLVSPTEVVFDWRSRYSGVTGAKMALAKASGEALNGWPAARTQLFRYADADTIFVGHALNNDLKVLHVSHKRVVDSGILVAEAVFGRGNGIPRRWGLKTLSRDLLGVTIQSSRGGHDCLEDTLASRELVLWCLREREQLAAWAEKALVQYEVEKRERAERQRAKEKEKERKKQEQEALSRAPVHSTGGYDSYDYNYGYEDGRDLLYDSDLFPPGYDPWSD
ncbi:ribonuclease H-like protein [Hypoxylon crocopeplum]|nr:ribonuclease H-like protein [Hypoxylon crocopeplum]